MLGSVIVEVKSSRKMDRGLVRFGDCTGKWTETVAISDDGPSDPDNFRLARHPTTIADLTLPILSRIAAIEFCLSRLSRGVDSGRCVEVGALRARGNTGCLTAARFVTSSRPRVAIHLGSLRPLPGLTFHR
jgi:hypothetical protein